MQIGETDQREGPTLDVRISPNQPVLAVWTTALRRTLLALVAGCMAGVLEAGPAPAELALGGAGNIKLYGDFRFRLESDRDSHKPDGSKRTDRDRVRIRARLGFQYALAGILAFGARVRTGSKYSQQSPHITIKDFDGNATGNHHLLFDRWFVEMSGKRLWAWAGRNNFPFWKQNEFFWDDDVTPAGLSAGYNLASGKGQYAVKTGYFSLPDGGIHFHGRLWGSQVVASTTSAGAGFTTAVGVFVLEGEPGARYLKNGNGSQDYIIWTGSVQLKLQAAVRPFTLGLDMLHNSEDYASTVPDGDERNGFVLSATLGQVKKAGNWLAGYSYARIEKFAVNASYAQDDWVRWGSATQTDSSDLKGHEFRVAYVFPKRVNLVARLYLVDAITSVQDGKRFRLDFNYKL